MNLIDKILMTQSIVIGVCLFLRTTIGDETSLKIKFIVGMPFLACLIGLPITMLIKVWY